MARVTAAYTFVRRLSQGEMEGRVALTLAGLARAVGPDASAAVLLTALLLALGEHAEVDYARELVFVRVALRPEDLHHLPPHAAVLAKDGRPFLALAAAGRIPLGYLPGPVREGLGRRAALVAASR
jgi:hypothetical protein